MSRTPGKRTAGEASLDDSDRPTGMPRESDNGRVLSDLHLAAANAHRMTNPDDTDDDEIQIHGDSMQITMPGKNSAIGGRKSGSKNYAASEHKYFLYLVDRLQAWAEGPTGETWAEISHRLFKKMGYRREAAVLHDHFLEMVNVARTVMRESGLLFPSHPEDLSMGPDGIAEQIDMAYLELGEQIVLAFQSRSGKKLSPSAWWDADVFANTARLSHDMENSSGGVITHDPALVDQRMKEIDYEEKNELSYFGRASLGGEGGRKSLGGALPVTPGSSLKEDLVEIKQSGKLLRKFDDRLTKVEEKIDMILKHLGVPN